MSSPIIAYMEANRRVNRAHAKRQKLKSHLSEAMRSDRRAARELMHRFIGNRDVAISCLHKAGAHRPTVLDWHTDVSNFNPLAPNDEVVSWWYKPKSSTGYRIVCDLPPKLKATHYIIKDLLEARCDAPNFVYNLRGGGGHDALAQDILRKLHEGFHHVRTYDVCDCFQHVSTDALYSLKLPRRLIQHAIDTDNLEFKQAAPKIGDIPVDVTDPSISDPYMTTEGTSGPTGIMQGSPAANLIFANILQSMPQPSPSRAVVGMFGDDLIVLARSEEICDEVETQIDQFLGQESVGPLILRHTNPECDNAFEYLGYEFRKAPLANEWTIGLSHRNQMKLIRKWREIVFAAHAATRSGIPLYDRSPIIQSLQGHQSLTDRAGTLEQILQAGPDDYEIAARVQIDQ
jgi:hypothetical protein